MTAANGVSQDAQEGAGPFHNNIDRTAHHMPAEEDTNELVEISQMGTILADKSCADVAEENNHVGVVADDNHVGVVADDNRVGGVVGVLHGAVVVAEQREVDVPIWTDAVTENDALTSMNLTSTNFPSPSP